MTTKSTHLPTGCHTPPVPNPDSGIVRSRVEDVWGVYIRKTYCIDLIFMVWQYEQFLLGFQVVYMNLKVIGSCYQLSSITRKSNGQDLGVRIAFVRLAANNQVLYIPQTSHDQELGSYRSCGQLSPHPQTMYLWYKLSDSDCYTQPSYYPARVSHL